MVEAAAGTTTMLLFNYRRKFAAPWMQGGSYRQIALPPLDRRDMTALLDALLGSDRTVAQFAQDVAERARAIRSLPRSWCRACRARPSRGRPGAYRLTHEIDAIPLPTTLEALLAARIAARRGGQAVLHSAPR